MEVQFYFDPMCPWAYRTSLWIREARAQRDLTVDWRFFSLEEVNREEGKRHPWQRPWSFGWSQMRIAALLRRHGGPDAVDTWYAAAGAAFFERGERTFTPDGARQVLVAAGQDPAVVDAAIADPTTTDEVLADHTRLLERHGGHGVPTLVFGDDVDAGHGADPGADPAGADLADAGNGRREGGHRSHAFFGPVVLHPPTGDAAGRLWDLVAGWREFPDLFELRRPKTDADVAAIGRAFAAYLDARAWRTIENPAR